MFTSTYTVLTVYPKDRPVSPLAVRVTISYPAFFHGHAHTDTWTDDTLTLAELQNGIAGNTVAKYSFKR